MAMIPRKMRCPVFLTFPASILFRTCTILILFSPTAITGFNVTQTLKNYEECSTFNLLLSETKLDEEINSLEAPLTLLAVSKASPSLNRKYPPSVLKMILSRHIVLDYIGESNIRNIVEDHEGNGFSTPPLKEQTTEGHENSNNQSILFKLEKNRSIRVTYHEGGDGTPSNFAPAHIKSFKKPMHNSFSILIVDSLLYDRKKEVGSAMDDKTMKTDKEKSSADQDPNAPISAPNASMLPHEDTNHSAVAPPPMKSDAAFVQTHVGFGVWLAFFLMALA